jgi:large subunit ribosomal protein L28
LASRCQLCGKAPVAGHNVSHSERKTKRRWLPNVQKTKLALGGVEQTVYICTRCMRTLAKASA